MIWGRGGFPDMIKGKVEGSLGSLSLGLDTQDSSPAWDLPGALGWEPWGGRWAGWAEANPSPIPSIQCDSSSLVPGQSQLNRQLRTTAFSWLGKSVKEHWDLGGGKRVLKGISGSWAKVITILTRAFPNVTLLANLVYVSLARQMAQKPRRGGLNFNLVSWKYCTRNTCL